MEFSVTLDPFELRVLYFGINICPTLIILRFYLLAKKAILTRPKWKSK